MEQSLRDLQGTTQHINLCVMKVPDEKQEKKGQEKYLKK